MKESPAKPRSRRKWLLAATVLGLVLLIAEAGSYVVVHYLAARGAIVKRWDPWNAFAEMTPAGLERFYQDRFDPRLGWLARPGLMSERGGTGDLRWQSRVDAVGARYNRLYPDAREMVAATYGDSFTYGSEVNDDETWQVAMSARLDRYIANFGVGAYGVDQAILRYQLEPPPGPAPKFVILTVFPGDLNRALSRWMAYLARDAWAAMLFKPRFQLVDGVLRTVPLPFLEPIHDLAVLDAHARRLRVGDPWYARQIALAPPWSYRLARVSMNLLADQFSIDIPWFSVIPGDVWASPSARDLMNAMIDHFIALARSRRSEPVIFFLDFGQIHGSRSHPLAAFIADLKRRLAAEGTPILTLSDPRLDRGRLRWRPGGHLAPEGNLAVADFLIEALGDRLKAVPERGGTSR